MDDVKTEASADHVPLDASLVEALQQHKTICYLTREGWLFVNPQTSRPYHQDTVQQKHIRKAAANAGLPDAVGWHSMRHSYRSWLADTGAPVGVQKELLRHASIQTTMNIYLEPCPTLNVGQIARLSIWCYDRSPVPMFSNPGEDVIALTGA